MIYLFYQIRVCYKHRLPTHAVPITMQSRININRPSHIFSYQGECLPR